MKDLRLPPLDSFIDFDRRQIPGLEKKDYIPFVMASSMSIGTVAPVPASPTYHAGDAKGCGEMPMCMPWADLQERNHELRKSVSFLMGSEPA